jgi:hypothetical protein
MSDASFEVGYPRRRWTETHLEIGHHDDAPAGVRVPALASPAHRVDGGKAPASQSNSRTTVRDAVAYIRGASEEDSDSATERSHASGDLGRGLGFWKLPTRSWVHAREHGDGRRSTPHSRHRADTMPARGTRRASTKKKWLRDQKSGANKRK